MVRALCFGLLSCWKMQWRPLNNFRLISFILFLRIEKYWSLFLIPCTLTLSPGPEAAKYRQSRMLPPTCINVWAHIFGGVSFIHLPSLITVVHLTIISSLHSFEDKTQLHYLLPYTKHCCLCSMDNIFWGSVSIYLKFSNMFFLSILAEINRFYQSLSYSQHKASRCASWKCHVVSLY